MNVKECIIKIIPLKSVQNPITSHQLHGYHQFLMCNSNGL